MRIHSLEKKTETTFQHVKRYPTITIISKTRINKASNQQQFPPYLATVVSQRLSVEKRLSHGARGSERTSVQMPNWGAICQVYQS